VLIATVICCGAEDKSSNTTLSPDERYLVDAYVRVRRAGAMYPFQREAGDSVLDHLAGVVDTVRVSRAIASLNATPERWTFIFQTIEQELGNQPSESTRS
jgi:hypothetical protein